MAYEKGPCGKYTATEYGCAIGYCPICGWEAATCHRMYMDQHVEVLRGEAAIVKDAPLMSSTDDANWSGPRAADGPCARSYTERSDQVCPDCGWVFSEHTRARWQDGACVSYQDEDGKCMVCGWREIDHAPSGYVRHQCHTCDHFYLSEVGSYPNCPECGSDFISLRGPDGRDGESDESP